MTSLKRTITHWTGGGGRANAKDKKHYHGITEFDGNYVEGHEEFHDNIVTSDGDYAAHTRNLNTGSIGLAMAGMLNATEYPLDFGPSPITRIQFEAHCKKLAELHVRFGIPVTPTTCLTHAEVEPTLGVKQRAKWDITVLKFEPNIRGAIPIGNYMRERVQAYMPADYPQSHDYPTVRSGSRGSFVSELQGLLAKVGYFTGRKDGIFGPRTRAAVMAFQSDNSLGVDGVVGPVTWSALMMTDEHTAPDRHIDMKELRNDGSRTVKNADQGQIAAGAIGGVTTLTAGAQVIEKASESIDTASSVLPTLQSALIENWLALIVIVAAALIWWQMSLIKKARLDDAKTGKNLGR